MLHGYNKQKIKLIRYNAMKKEYPLNAEKQKISKKSKIIHKPL